jgi:ankyrin repeat protein
MKLSWLLGQGLSPDEVRAAVGTSLRGEITEATSTRWSLDDPRFAAAIARVLGAPDPGAPVDGLRAALLPSLLGAAATHGDVAALRLLLSAAGAVNLADADGRTALHRAAAAGHLEVVHALLKAGADPFVLDQRGRSSLTEAYERGHAAIIDALVAAGASVRADDLDLALRGAARRGSAEATRALLDAGADPSAADTLGRTALHLAGLAGCAETWALLVDGGADLTRTDRFGHTAEQLAASVGHRLGRNGPAKS